MMRTLFACLLYIALQSTQATSMQTLDPVIPNSAINYNPQDQVLLTFGPTGLHTDSQYAFLVGTEEKLRKFLGPLWRQHKANVLSQANIHNEDDIDELHLKAVKAGQFQHRLSMQLRQSITEEELQNVWQQRVSELARLIVWRSLDIIPLEDALKLAEKQIHETDIEAAISRKVRAQNIKSVKEKFYSVVDEPLNTNSKWTDGSFKSILRNYSFFIVKGTEIYSPTMGILGRPAKFVQIKPPHRNFTKVLSKLQQMTGDTFIWQEDFPRKKLLSLSLRNKIYQPLNRDKRDWMDRPQNGSSWRFDEDYNWFYDRLRRYRDWRNKVFQNSEHFLITADSPNGIRILEPIISTKWREVFEQLNLVKKVISDDHYEEDRSGQEKLENTVDFYTMFEARELAERLSNLKP